MMLSVNVVPSAGEALIFGFDGVGGIGGTGPPPTVPYSSMRSTGPEAVMVTLLKESIGLS